MNQGLIAVEGQKVALERTYAKKLLNLNPGLGDKSLAMVQSLADSALDAVHGATLLQLVFSPVYKASSGQGMATRARWFMEALRDHYGDRLQKAGQDLGHFRSLVADVEDIIELRDILNGDGYPVSFQSAFVFWELGLNAECIESMIGDHLGGIAHQQGMCIGLVAKAALKVKSGIYPSLESALRFEYGHHGCEEWEANSEDEE